MEFPGATFKVGCHLRKGWYWHLVTPQYAGVVHSLCRVQTQSRERLRLEKPNDLGSRLRQEEKTRPTRGAAGAMEAQLPGARPGDLATRSRAGSEDAGAAAQQETTSRSQRSGSIRQPGAVMAEKPRGPLPRLLPKWPKPRGCSVEQEGRLGWRGRPGSSCPWRRSLKLPVTLRTVLVTV